ncbi:hypothetical protein P4S72_05850 [Vibrio sp. PP-XX7]
MSERGAVTLLVTVMVMTTALILVMRSHQSVRYQVAALEAIRERRASFWQAEGLIECLWAQKYHAIMGGVDSGDISPCEIKTATVNLSGQRTTSLVVTVGHVTLERRYKLPLPTTPGVMKSSSHLILTQKARFAPDPGEQDSNHQWQCAVLRYGHRFEAPSVTTYDLAQLTEKPYPDFPDLAGQTCATNYRSVAQDAAHTKQDYLYDPTLSLFEDLFGVDRAQWLQVMGSPDVGLVPLTLSLPASSSSLLPPPVFNQACAQQIIERIDQGKMIIWVYGGCVFSDQEIEQMNQAIRATFHDHGIILVVQDGLLGIKSDRAFLGMLFHFLSPDQQNKRFERWPEIPWFDDMQPIVSDRAIPLEQLSYFQLGQFYPVAGLILDAELHFAVIDGALDFRYQRDWVMRPLSLIRPFSWASGSWDEH